MGSRRRRRAPSPRRRARADTGPHPLAGLTPAQSGERQRILDALAACAGNQSRAAKMLGMPRRTFVARLDQYKIPRPKKDLLRETPDADDDAEA